MLTVAKAKRVVRRVMGVVPLVFVVNPVAIIRREPREVVRVHYIMGFFGRTDGIP